MRDDFRARSITGPLFDQPAGRAPAGESSPGDGLLAQEIGLCCGSREATEVEAAVALRIYRRHQGRAKPCPLAELKAETGLDERAVKKSIESLRRVFRLPIGARRQEPSGYFWIADAEDQAEAAKPYEEQIISMARTLRVINSPSRMQRFLGQLRMELEGETE